MTVVSGQKMEIVLALDHIIAKDAKKMNLTMWYSDLWVLVEGIPGLCIVRTLENVYAMKKLLVCNSWDL